MSNNNATPALTTFDVAAATFDGIRPAVVRYADHERKARAASDALASHADITKVWERVEHLTDQNQRAGKKNPSRGVHLEVAREVLNLPGLTLTREEGKDQTVDQKRLEAFKKWLDNNNPAPAAPKPVRLAVTMSGDDAPVTGTLAIDPNEHPDVYATLVAMLAEAQAAAGK